MDALKVIASFATLAVLFLAVADGVEESGEIRHFDAHSAFDSVSDTDLQFINDVKLRTNNNWNKLGDIPSNDYSALKNEIDLDLNLIINNEFKMDETWKTSSSQSIEPDVADIHSTNYEDQYYEDLYSGGQISSPHIRIGLKFGKSVDSAHPPGLSDQTKFGSSFDDVDADILFLKSDISSKLDQIAF